MPSSSLMHKTASRTGARSWIALAAIIVAVYWQTLKAPFFYDDLISIVDNDSIRALWPPSRTLWAPQATPTSGRPLVNLSFALDYAAGGLDVRGYRAVNIAFHILCASLLMGIVRRSALRTELKEWAAALAFIIAATWALHPLCGQVVGYMTQRTELMGSLFILLTLYCCVRAWDTQRRTIAWNIAAVLSCAAGMASKEIVYCAPLLVVLWDRAFVSGSLATAFRRRGALYAALAATWIILAYLLSSAPHGKGVGVLAGASTWQYVLTQAEIVAWYLRLCFWPTPLVLAHDWPLVVSLRAALPQVLLVTVLLAAAAWALWRHPRVGFLAAAFFLILLPTSSVVQLSEIAAERRMYLPLASLIALLVFTIALPLSKSSLLLRRLAVGASVAVCAGLAIVSVSYAREMNHPIALWNRALAMYPNFVTGHNDLGLVLCAAGNQSEGIASFRRALSINPDSVDAHINLGAQLALAGQFPEAIEHLRTAARLAPSDARTWRNLAVALTLQGQLREAAGAYRQALKFRPNWIQGLNDLAWILATHPSAEMRNGAEAVRLAQRASSLQNPPSPSHLDTLAAAYAQCGRFDDARAAAREAIRLAERAGDRQHADEFRAHLLILESDQPIREPSEPTTATNP